MCSTHAILVCNIKGAMLIQKCVTEDYYRKRGWDMSLSHMQPHYNIYALKKPLFYQDKKYGGQEENTKIILKNVNDIKTIKEEFFNTSNYSFITNIDINNINNENVIFQGKKEENLIKKNEKKYTKILMISMFFVLILLKKIHKF